MEQAPIRGIEEKINRYERKLQDIRSLRNSLGLEPGANSSALGYLSAVEQSSDDWRNSWPVSIFPSQAAVTWWQSPTREQPLTYDGPDWFERSSPKRQRTEWNAVSPQIWTATVHKFEDLTDRSGMEAQQETTLSSRRSGRRPESRRDRRSPTGSSPRSHPKKEEPSGGITQTLSGLLTSA